jgi:hypothetical protein
VPAEIGRRETPVAEPPGVQLLRRRDVEQETAGRGYER